MQVVYLGISGVLHPSKSAYTFIVGRAPVHDGRQEFEAIGVLEEALAPFPDAHIVLTSTLPRLHGLPWVLERLGPTLSDRVIGFTYEDLTTKAGTGPRQVLTAEDYWRCSKAQVVQKHVAWLKPSAWIAVDDEGSQWPADIATQNLVWTHPCRGLMDRAAQDRLHTVLLGNFRLYLGVT